ncbi:MAG: DUF1232 domain-containing protein [Paludibacteraceae bacterium]|nr:DUF1232 domain-containing protein [Paludibacteraceae bacterium]
MKSENNEMEDSQAGGGLPEKPSGVGIGSWVGLVLALIYGVSPLDLSPDAMPVVGWFDDLVVIGAGVLNFVQHWTEESNELLSRILRILKWVLILVGVVVFLLLVVLILLGIRVFS